MKLIIANLVVFCFTNSANAYTSKDCYLFSGCIGSGRSSSASSNPSYSNQIRINPSAVPTEKGVGLEAILYKTEVDFSLVQGLGRVGAGISPSNSEETFFGPPGVEMTNDYLDRKIKGQKFPNQKITLATAVSLIKRDGSGWTDRSLQIGVMGRYNTRTKNTGTGAGVSGLLGPLTFGGSIYNDETRLDDETYSLESDKPVVKYQVKTYSGGLSLNSLLVDYSVLEAVENGTDVKSTVRLLTASLLVKRFIFTLSQRSEDSARPDYNYELKQLETKQKKYDLFWAVQFNLTDYFMLGLLSNYYMLHEYSVSATVFF